MQKCYININYLLHLSQKIVKRLGNVSIPAGIIVLKAIAGIQKKCIPILSEESIHHLITFQL